MSKSSWSDLLQTCPQRPTQIVGQDLYMREAEQTAKLRRYSAEQIINHKCVDRIWSFDLMRARTHIWELFQIPNVIDGYSRESLASKVASHLAQQEGLEVLTHLFIQKGLTESAVIMVPTTQYQPVGLI